MRERGPFGGAQDRSDERNEGKQPSFFLGVGARKKNLRAFFLGEARAPNSGEEMKPGRRAEQAESFGTH